MDGTLSPPPGSSFRFDSVEGVGATPSGWEDYMRDLAAAIGEGKISSADDLARIASRYDFRVA